MPSTDRLLWLLQMALFLVIPLYYLLLFFLTASGTAAPECPRFIYEDPYGQRSVLTQEFCDDGGVIAMIPAFVLMWLWSLGLGAVIFCLRRIGRSMGAS